MSRFVRSLILAAVSMAITGAAAQTQDTGDVVTFISKDDPLMNKAFKRARAELDDFLATARTPAGHQSDFAVKVGLRDGEKVEYVWISDFVEDARGNFSGVINNEIEVVKKYRLGDKVRFARADIVDWLYFDAREVRMYGNYTLCALLAQQDADEAAAVKKQYKLDCAL